MNKEMILALQQALAQGAKTFDFGFQAEQAMTEARVKSANATAL